MSLTIGPFNAAKLLLKDSKLSLVYAEAVANSLDWGAKKINIEIRIKDPSAIDTLRIRIEDDGTGIDAEGFLRFAKLNEPRDKAHRGIGRLAYVANFNRVKVTSYTKTEIRQFTFDNSFSPVDTPAENKGKIQGTVIELSDYSKERIHDHGFIRPASIKDLLLKEFFPRFYGLKKRGKKLKIRITLAIDSDGEKQNLFADTQEIDVQDLPDLTEIPFDPSPALMLTEMKLCYHIDINFKGKSLICGFDIDGRSYSVQALTDDNLPIDTRAIFILSSDYFDGRSDSTREKVEIDAVTIKGLQQRMSVEIDKLLKMRIPSIDKTNEATISEVKETFPHLEGYFPVGAVGVLSRNEMIEKATAKFVADQRVVLEAEELTEEEFDKALDLSARVLMEYVLYRNKTLDKLSAIDIDSSEYDVHNLIVPRRRTYVNGHLESIYTNNAWVMDDKFMTYSKILSEAELSAVIAEITDEDVDKDVTGRPDIALIFSKQGGPSETVDLVVVEIKKRHPELSEEENVISQLRQRARRILKYYNTKLQRVWYYGIAGITPEMLQVFSEDRWSELYATGQVWYKEYPMRAIGETNGPEVPVGFFIMPYDTMLKDARGRNATFLNLLKQSIKGKSE